MYKKYTGCFYGRNFSGVGRRGEEKKSQSKRGDILDGDVSRVKRKLQRPEGSDCSSLHYKAGPLLGPGKLFSFESLLNKAH